MLKTLQTTRNKQSNFQTEASEQRLQSVVIIFNTSEWSNLWWVQHHNLRISLKYNIFLAIC